MICCLDMFAMHSASINTVFMNRYSRISYLAFSSELLNIPWLSNRSTDFWLTMVLYTSTQDENDGRPLLAASATHSSE